MENKMKLEKKVITPKQIKEMNLKYGDVIEITIKTGLEPNRNLGYFESMDKNYFNYKTCTEIPSNISSVLIQFIEDIKILDYKK